MTIKTQETDAGIPDFLKRETNAKGVTLSAGVSATGAKTEPKVTKVPAGKTAKQLAKDAVKRDRQVERHAKTATQKAEKVAKVAKPAKAEKVAKVVSTPVIDPATGEAIEKVRRSIVPMKFKERYKSHGGTCGDDMALELKAATTTRNADKREVLDVAALWAIARVNNVDVSKYVDLNNGQKRMNVGNKLRGLVENGVTVVIGKRKFKGADVPKNLR